MKYIYITVLFLALASCKNNVKKLNKIDPLPADTCFNVLTHSKKEECLRACIIFNKMKKEVTEICKLSNSECKKAMCTLKINEKAINSLCN